MGTLRRFNLRYLLTTTGIETLIETGTGEGQSVKWALNCNFKAIFSAEIETQLYKRALQDLKEFQNVRLSNCDSISFLNGLPDEISASKLFFLDAHFAGGADFKLTSFAESIESSQSFPLLDEVAALQGQLGADDVLIIDDARIYQPGSFQEGECPEFARRWEDLEALEALFDYWSESHDLITLECDHGYFCLVPKRYDSEFPKWLNIRPNDADLQRLEFRYGIPGVTAISIQRRLQDTRFVSRYFVGDGLDVGGGQDSLALYGELFPLMHRVFTYDQNHGDAQYLENVADESFDFLYSSHCLEHLRDPYTALANWLRVVKKGGHLIIQVPDEDLYEQGTWPSRFNPDHKLSFTIAKTSSWSPVSVNVIDLIRSAMTIATPLSVMLIDHAHRRDTLTRDLDQTRTPLAEAAIEFILRKN